MRSIVKNKIFSISFATGLSKLAGFIRQLFIAAAFGVGISYDAYNYAYIIPGFLLIIIGGINGPLHNSVVAILTPLKEKKAGLILTRVGLRLTLFLIFIGVFIFLNANIIVKFIAPNLFLEAQLNAAEQLKILAPCIPLSGFIGLSFGALNSKNKFFISSLSPSIISIVTVLFIIGNWILNHKNNIELSFVNSNLIAISTLTGTLIQFTIQIYELAKIGLLKFPIVWDIGLKEEKRMYNIIIPSSLASGLGQINVFVDMFFASSFRGAASGLAYGNFLIQAPLGILSNALILPLLPKIANLKYKNETRNLEKSLIKSIEYCLLTTFFLTGLFIAFNEQIVELFFKRGAFNKEAVFIVKQILIAYAIGLPFYLLRDLLVRIYYVMEKIKITFQLSVLGIVMNILFDWLLIGAPIINSSNLLPFNFGITGIVLSSGFVNLIICLILIIRFQSQRIDFPTKILFKKFTLLLASCVFSTNLSYFLAQNLNLKESIFWINSLSLLLNILVFFLIYFFVTKLLGVNKLSVKFN